MDGRALTEKRKAAEDQLRKLGRVIVAFSGGVDSTLLAKLARAVLGRGNALAVTADSPSLAREDLAEARRLAAALDCEHLVIQTRELERTEYRANTARRCYFCKHTLFEELDTLAAAGSFASVVYGAIASDLPAERPGQRAALEYGVRAPLQEAGLEKWEIRELARELGLPNWDRPQNACLSSRIPYGEPVTEEKLRQVEHAEHVLRSHGFRQVRVRHLGESARIEVGLNELARFQDPSLRRRMIGALLQLGFSTVSIDQRGYRPGGANRPVTAAWVLQADAPADTEVVG